MTGVVAVKLFQLICYTRELSSLLVNSRQLPGTVYAVPIQIAQQSVVASLARHAIIAELRLPTKLNLIFA